MGKRKREDFTNFISDVLQKSMLTGIPQIATAGNMPKKIIRAIVFLACVAGFIYQSIMFMQIYWKYETVIDVKVTNPERIDLPSYTVCNYNGFAMSKICEDPKYVNGCQYLEDSSKRPWKWCDCMPRYCVDGVLKKLKVPDWKDLYALERMSFEEYEKFLIPFNETFWYCMWNRYQDGVTQEPCDVDYYQRIRAPHTLSGVMNGCFTINTLIGRPEAEPRVVNSDGSMTLELNPNPLEYSTIVSTISMQVAFHQPRTVINPYDEGYSLYPGYNYYIRMKKVVKNLLPAPYETDCQDYIALWKLRNGTGPTSHRECIEECQKNASIQVQGCVDKFIRAPGNEKRCGIYMDPREILRLARECSNENCKPACYEEKYEISKDSVDRNLLNTCGTKQIDYNLEIRLFFDGMETTTYTYSPKFENIETFSYLGGYVGMWLGISLVALFDFIETMVVMMKYPCKKYFDYRARKTRIQNLQRIQRTL